MREGPVGKSGSIHHDELAISIVVPAYNEFSRLDVGFRRMQAAIDHGAVDPTATEFIFVDDGSTDGTGDHARELSAGFPNFVLIRVAHNTGKGAAVRAGVAKARGAVVAFMDADMAVDPVQIPLMVAALEHADMAIGSRSMPGSSVDRDDLRRSLMGRSFNAIVNSTTHLALGDTQCGFKAFRAPVARILFHCTTTERFAFDVEVLYTARRLRGNRSGSGLHGGGRS